MKPLNLLIVEDSEDDEILLLHHLSRAGYDVQSVRVQTAAEMKAALTMHEWDLIISDYAMPGFTGLDALGILKNSGLDIPFIVISGTIGEEVAVQAMLLGVHDYLIKGNLTRLSPAIERELNEVENRRARQRAEEALKKAEEKYRSIFENAVEGIFQSTPEGQFLAVNPAMSRMLGYESPNDLIDHCNSIKGQYYVDPDSRPKLMQMLAENDVVTGFESEVYCQDLSKIWTIENIRAIRDENGTLLYFEGSVEDITERKHLEEQLRQSQKLEAIGLLAGGIAHDFNNLLTAINGYSDLTIRKLQNGDPLRSNIEEIRKAGERAASLTSQLLAFSRKQVLQPKIVDLNVIVAEMGDMLRRLIGENIELRTVPDSELGSIKADPGQLGQVIMNLVVNARDAMPGGGKLSIETKNVYLDETFARQHIAVCPGYYVMLAISDTGIGMSEQTQDRIFEPFFTMKELGKGTGLGLSTVYGIIKQSGGHIWVYSELEHGTTFKVYLPRVEEYPQRLQRRSGVETDFQGTETILLVEDEEIVRKLAHELLDMNGYQVLEAANGNEALLICERYEGPIHLLLTDVVMPKMGGKELADRLSQLRPQIKVLYMSGYTDDAIVEHGVLDSNINFLQKPFTADDLSHKIREILDSSPNN